MQMLEVPGDAGDCLMRFATQLARGRAEVFVRKVALLLRRIRKTFMPAPDQGIGAPQEPDRSFDSRLRPAQFVFNGRRKQDKQPRRIRAIGRDHLIGIDAVAQAFGHGLPLVGAFDAISDHALSQQSLYRLIKGDQPQVTHDLGPEPRVDQMHDGVRVAADVLVHRRPLRRKLRIEWRRIVTRIAIAKEVPGRIHKGIHGVRLAPRRTLAPRTSGVDELSDSHQRRFTCAGKGSRLWQDNRQLVQRDRNHAALLAVHNGDGCAPETLARDTPIADAIGYRRRAKSFLCGVSRHRPQSIFGKAAAPLTAIYQHSIIGKGLMHFHRLVHGTQDWFNLRLGMRNRSDDLPDWQRVLLRELEVALVMRGHAHDCAGAIIHQHIIRHPDGKALAAERIQRQHARMQTFLLFHYCQILLRRPGGFHSLGKSLYVRPQR